MVHSGAVEGQPAFAAKGVIDGQLDQPGRSEQADQQEREHFGEFVQFPDVLTEEAMVVGKVALADGAGRENQVGHEAMAV